MSTFRHAPGCEGAASGYLRPVVFLDFDGVLSVSPGDTRGYVVSLFKHRRQDHLDVWADLFCMQAAANLRTLHLEFSPIYVVTSAWTRDLTREQVHKVLECTDLRFVSMHMHEQWTTPKGVGSPRLTEIERWIAVHHLAQDPILIIDDDESGWSLHQSRLDTQGKVVLCAPNRGFDAVSLNEAQRLLQAQLGANL